MLRAGLKPKTLPALARRAGFDLRGPAFRAGSNLFALSCGVYLQPALQCTPRYRLPVKSMTAARAGTAAAHHMLKNQI